MTNTKIIWMLLSLTVILMAVIRIQNVQLITPSAPMGILSLEFSTTADQINDIQREWTGEVRQAFYLNTVLDYFYIFFYGMFLFFTCRYFAILKPGVSRLGLYASLAGLTAAGLDAIENLLMVISIHFAGSDLIGISTATIASVKFLLAALALLYILFSAVARLIRRK